MKKFKNKNLKKINLNYSKIKIVNPNFNILLNKRKNYIKDNFRNNLFTVRQLKLKAAMRSLNYFKNFQKKNKNFNINNFLKMYFQRLDVVLYNSGIFPTIFSARQAILYKKIIINNQIITKNNFLLSMGDIITFNKKKLNIKSIKKQKNYQSSFYEINYKILAIIILSSVVFQEELIKKLSFYNWLTLKHRFR